MDASERERSRLDQVFGFCADTTAHGLGRAAAAKSWVARLFWIAIFIAAFIYSILQICKSVVAYLSYPTKTDISLVNKEKLPFPAVTVCNINPFKQSEIKNSSLWHEMVSILILYRFFFFRNSLVAIEHNCRTVEMLINRIVSSFHISLSYIYSLVVKIISKKKKTSDICCHVSFFIYLFIYSFIYLLTALYVLANTNRTLKLPSNGKSFLVRN